MKLTLYTEKKQQHEFRPVSLHRRGKFQKHTSRLGQEARKFSTIFPSHISAARSHRPGPHPPWSRKWKSSSRSTIHPGIRTTSCFSCWSNLLSRGMASGHSNTFAHRHTRRGKFIVMCVVFLMYRSPSSPRRRRESRRKLACHGCCFRSPSPTDRPVVPSGPLYSECVCCLYNNKTNGNWAKKKGRITYIKEAKLDGRFVSSFFAENILRIRNSVVMWCVLRFFSAMCIACQKSLTVRRERTRFDYSSRGWFLPPVFVSQRLKFARKKSENVMSGKSWWKNISRRIRKVFRLKLHRQSREAREKKAHITKIQNRCFRSAL